MCSNTFAPGRLRAHCGGPSMLLSRGAAKPAMLSSAINMAICTIEIQNVNVINQLLYICLFSSEQGLHGGIQQDKHGQHIIIGLIGPGCT